MVLRKGATKACSFEEVIIYSHYIGVTNGFSELNSSVKQRPIVQVEFRVYMRRGYTLYYIYSYILC